MRLDQELIAIRAERVHPESFRPLWDMTILTSGDCRMSCRMRAAVSADSSSEIPGGRFERTQITPSSSCGRNSVPTAPASARPRSTSAGCRGDDKPRVRERPTHRHFVSVEHPIEHWIPPGTGAMAKYPCGQHGDEREREHDAPSSAKHTVYAIGVNSRRSTRSSANSGR